MVRQVNGNFEAKEERMVKYLEKVNDLKKKFNHFKLVWIEHGENSEADALSKLALGSQEVGEQF